MADHRGEAGSALPPTPHTPVLDPPPADSREPRQRSTLYGLLTASAISLSGTRLSMIALPWFVVTSTGSAALTGAVAAAQMTPYVVAKALAGPVVDRLGARRVVVIAEVASAAVVTMVPLLHLWGRLDIGVLMVVVALLGLVSGPADGGKAALIPVTAERAQVPLERVTGLFGSIERLASTLGAAAAGAVVALIGAVPSLWITAATFALASGVLALSAPRVPSREEPGRYLTDLREGLAFIGRDRLLRSLYAMVSATNLLDTAAFTVLLPIWALHTGRGPAAIGLLAAVMSGFAIASSLIAAAWGHRMPRRATYLACYLIAGLPRFAVLALDVPMEVVVVVFAISGFGAGFLNPILGAVIFERIPRPLVGRVSSMGSSLAWAGMPVGGLAGGALVAASGLIPALWVCGIAYFLATTLPGLQQEWREMERASDRSVG